MERERVIFEQGGAPGMAWVAGWLFTLGYADLGFWRGLLALLLWPYLLGAELAAP